MKKSLLFLMLLTYIVLTSCNSNNNNNEFLYNEVLYKEFIEEFEHIKNQMEFSNQIVFDMNIEMDVWEDKSLLGKTDAKTKFKVNGNPLYIEADVRSGVESHKYVYEQVEDSIYQYEIVGNTSISSFYSSVDGFESNEENGALGFKFDKKNGKAQIEGDYYVFTQKYENALTDEEKSYLENLYDVLGVSLDDVLNSELTTKFKFNENGFYMSYDMKTTVNMEYPNWPGHYEEMTIDAFIEYDFKIEEFIMIDLNEYEHISDKINGVSQYSKLDTSYTLYDFAKYYKFNLKKGYYYFSTVKNNKVSAEFYDSKHTKFYPEYLLDMDQNEIYYIPEDGDYYIGVRGYGRSFMLHEFNIYNKKVMDVKYNEEMVFDLKQDQFASFKIDDLPSILVENTGENDIKLTSTDIDRDFIIPAKTKMYVFIGIIPKEVLIENIGSNGEECRVKISKIESAGVNLSYDKLEEITTTPSKGYYVHGGYLDIPMVKLIAKESGFYTLKNSCEESSNFTHVIEYYNGGYIQWIEDDKYYLAEGEYIIRLENNSTYGFSYGNVYYEFEKYEAQTSYEIELEKTTKKPYEREYPTILLHYTIGADYYKYYFTITEDCVVETYNYLYLYDENGAIVTGTSQKKFNLKPGRYYFTSNSRITDGTDQIKIAITG